MSLDSLKAPSTLFPHGMIIFHVTQTTAFVVSAHQIATYGTLGGIFITFNGRLVSVNQPLI
jgi:hypothetical protein